MFTLIKEFTTAILIFPVPLHSEISIVPNQDFVRFGGQYHGSKKTPNLAVKFVNSKEYFEIKFILETSFSESYDDLVQDAEL
jgi:hypothetical protein